MIEELDDKELYDRLHKAGLVEKLETDEHWKMLNEARRRIIDRAVNEFAFKTKTDDILKVTELQVILRKYLRGLFDEVESLKRESTMLYEEAKQRGLVGDFYQNVKERLFGR